MQNNEIVCSFQKEGQKKKSYSKRYLTNTKHPPQSFQSKYLNKIYFFHVGEKK